MRETHVAGEAQHDLWRSIPPSSNVFSDEISVETSLSVGTSPRRISSCETEVQDFELTVIIDQEVTQLEVTGNDVRGVNVLETAKGLMNKRPEMSVGEWLLGADLCRELSVTRLADTERRIDRLQWRADRPPSTPTPRRPECHCIRRRPGWG